MYKIHIHIVTESNEVSTKAVSAQDDPTKSHETAKSESSDKRTNNVSTTTASKTHDERSDEVSKTVIRASETTPKTANKTRKRETMFDGLETSEEVERRKVRKYTAKTSKSLEEEMRTESSQMKSNDDMHLDSRSATIAEDDDVEMKTKSETREEKSNFDEDFDVKTIEKANANVKVTEITEQKTAEKDSNIKITPSLDNNDTMTANTISTESSNQNTITIPKNVHVHVIEECAKTLQQKYPYYKGDDYQLLCEKQNFHPSHFEEIIRRFKEMQGSQHWSDDVQKDGDVEREIDTLHLYLLSKDGRWTLSTKLPRDKRTVGEGDILYFRNIRPYGSTESPKTVQVQIGRIKEELSETIPFTILSPMKLCCLVHWMVMRH